MRAAGAGRRGLSSWKEIAEYLGVAVRTAQHWEAKRGLPVRRFSGEKGPVWADPAELDRWRQTHLTRSRWWSEARLWRVWAAAATAAIVIAGAGYLLSNRRGPPARFHHEFMSLVVSDERGREIWRKTFAGTFHHLATPEDLLTAHRAWFGDLDDDGRIELLYTYSPASLDSDSETLFCFSDTGREKWRFVPGREVSSRKTTFPRRYNGIGFKLLRPGPDGARRIVLIAHHHPRYPSQAVVLSHQGAVLGEYWHSGHFGPMELVDLDGDGEEEILICATSNGYGSAALMVLDPSDLAGASQEENADYQLQGFEAGREKARILFPRTCINRKFNDYGVPARLAVQGHSIEVGVVERTSAPAGPEPLVFYYLNRRLELMSVTLNDPLKALHRELEAARQLDHPLTEEEIAELRRLRVLKAFGR